MQIKTIVKKNKYLYKLALKILLIRGILLNINNFPWYLNSRRAFLKAQASNKDGYKFNKFVFFPILGDRGANAGTAGMYLIQDLWAAKKISSLSKEYTHFDIGSRVDGFITHLLCFRGNVTLIDIRPLPYFIDDELSFIQADATNLNDMEDNSIYSLSALCSLEHFGLGRYGDPIDPMACFKAFDAIQRVIKPGGRAYISVPIGLERIEFNAHRVFNPKTIVECFNNMDLIEFSVATNDTEIPLIKNANLEAYDNIDLYFGLFEFEKRSSKNK